MKTRPWPILILALLYLFGPIFNTLTAALIMKINWFEYMHRIWMYGNLWDWITVFAIYPMAAIAIYVVKPWSYPVYMCVMGAAIIANLNDYMRYSQVFTTGVLIFTMVFNIALVSYFLIPAVRAAYFDRKLRWWEAKPRYEVRVPALFTAEAGEKKGEWKGMVTNLSEGGVFVQTSHRMKDQEVVILSFSLFNRPASVKARVVYHAPGMQGYGLQFVHSRETRIRMHRISKGLRLLGIEPRGGQIDHVKSFMDWTKGLMTGRGWVPDVSREPQLGLARKTDKGRKKEREANRNKHEKAA